MPKLNKSYKTKPSDIDTITEGQWITVLGPNLRFFNAADLSDDPDGLSSKWTLDPNTKIALHPSSARFHHLIGIPLKVIDTMDPLVQVLCFNSWGIPICIRVFDTRSVALGPCSKRWVSRFFRCAKTIETCKLEFQNSPQSDEGIPSISEHAGWSPPAYHERDPKIIHVEAQNPDKKEKENPPEESA